MRRLMLPGCGAVLICCVAGCGAPATQAPIIANGANADANAGAGGQVAAESGLWHEAARATRIARAYDAGIEAARRNDEKAFVAACSRLRELRAMPEAVSLASNAAVGEAEKAVSTAILLDMRAQQAIETPSQSGEDQMLPAVLRLQAAREYRRALTLSPRFDSPDPAKLNALAYFLAERGAGNRDFEMGEDLARRAISSWNEAIAQAPSRNFAPELWKLSRAETRDTLAWALFRRNRLGEALREQQNAVRELDSTLRALALSMPTKRTSNGNGAARAELLFHLGEILRALHRDDEARTQFQAALKADPTHLPSRQSLRAMNAIAP